MQDLPRGIMSWINATAVSAPRGELAKLTVVRWFCDEDAIVRELALEERIDAKIDKDIVALGRMKTMQAVAATAKSQKAN